MSVRLSSAQFATLTGRPKRNKFNARTRCLDGINFASGKEAKRWIELTLLQAAGQISQLTAHPVYELEVNRVRIGKYTADSSYITADGEFIVEDVKSPVTRRETSYRLRRKLFAACYWPLEITEWP